MENNESTPKKEKDFTKHYGYAKLPENVKWHRLENGKVRVLTKEEVSEMKQKLRNNETTH